MTKPKVKLKRSKLQQAQSQGNWVVNFRLHYPKPTELSSLILSRQTKSMLKNYEDLCIPLRVCILQDMESTKKLIKERESNKNIDI